MDDHPGDRDRRNERERPLEELLVRRVVKQVPADSADSKRREDTHMDRTHQLAASRLPQVRETDRDDEKGFEPLPQRNNKGL